MAPLVLVHMEKYAVKNWLMSESSKRLQAVQANPTDVTLMALHEIKARLQAEVRMVERKILELDGDDQDDSQF